ncbi:MAG: hypothetical protein Q9170_005904 [Blastenia crenularia]
MAATSVLTQRPLTATSSVPKVTIRAESPTRAATSEASARGAAIYSHSLLLAIYDWWVLGIVSTYAWACSVPHVILPWFRSNVRKGQHLDIGVGTGYHLAKTDLSGVQVTLADLNQEVLDATKNRLVSEGKVKADEIRCLLHDITRPLPSSCPKFNSISLYYLLHCMPGPVPAKTAIFAHLKYSLTPDGVISGASILGKGVRFNLFGRIIMTFGNWNGMFDNLADNKEDFEEALREHFDEVEVKVQGVILIWRASKPKI